MLDDDLGTTGDEATGVNIVRRAAVEPLRWIAENAGLEGYVVVDKVRNLPRRPGARRRHRRLRRPAWRRGVIDPVKVTRSALRNAASIASMVLTTDTLVVEKKEPQPEETGHGHGHGHWPHPVQRRGPVPFGGRASTHPAARFGSDGAERRPASPVRGCGPLVVRNVLGCRPGQTATGIGRRRSVE